jgi:hypothetical protein
MCSGVVWLVPYAVAYLSIQLFDAVAAAPYLALVPDIVSQAQARHTRHTPHATRHTPHATRHTPHT